MAKNLPFYTLNLVWSLITKLSFIKAIIINLANYDKFVRNILISQFISINL